MSIRKAKKRRSPASAQRRRPQQQRAIRRVEKILAAANAIIMEQGLAKLTVREVAHRSNMPMATIYQYFGSLEHIVEALVTPVYEKVRASIEAAYRDIRTIDDFVRQTLLSLHEAIAIYESFPIYVELWYGGTMWEPIRDLEHNDTLRTANRMAIAIQAVRPQISPEKARAIGVVLCESGTAVIRWVLQQERKERRACLAELFRMIETYLRERLLDRGVPRAG